MAKGYVNGSCSVIAASDASYTLRCSGSYTFGLWYLWGVRVRCYINGRQVATAAGYTTGVNQTTAGCQGDLSIARGHSDQNIGWRVEYNGETVNGIGALGESGSRSGSIIVPAKPSYAVRYDANGGSGAPSAQTKWYGERLTLSNGRPNRSLYTFKGWATSKGGGADYQPGASYDGNAALTLYAVWEIAYIPPTISSTRCYRCDADGNVSDEGQYVFAEFTYKVDTKTVPGNKGTPGIGMRDSGSTGEYSYGRLTGSGATVRTIIPGALTDKQYQVVFQVKDSTSYANSTTRAYGTVTRAYFTIDFFRGGHGLAFGAAATQTGFECAMDAVFTGRLKVGSTELTEDKLKKLLALV